MEVKLVVTLVAWMLFCISTRGYAECGLSDISVTQTTMPGQRGGYPLYLVSVQNRCNCTQTNVRLTCAGFNSSIPVEPQGAINPEEDSGICIFIGGKPVTNREAFQFYYAWSTKFSFVPVSSDVYCSVA